MKTTNTTRLFKVLLLLAIAMLSAWSPCKAGSPPPVPPSYQALYNSLNSDLAAFNATLGTPAKYPTAYAGDLVVAAGDTGPSLATQSGGAAMQINALKSMGLQAVMIQVGFPILDPNFYTFLQTQPGFSSVTYAQMQNYYQQVAQNVHAAGMKLIVENDVLMSNDAQAGWSPASGNYYATLDWPTFQTRHAQCALNIAQIMQPDYLVILESPDTEAAQAIQPNFGTVSGATSYITQALTTLAPVRGNMKIGAGVENYLVASPGFASFISSFLALPAPGLDFIDMQIYPINNIGGSTGNFLQNALTIAQMAQAAGKPVSITEAWMWKLRNSEWNNVNYDSLRARDPFSFWSPLDSYFIQTLENLANYTQMLFMAPEGGNYLYAYEPYNSTTSTWSPSVMLTNEGQAAQAANRVGAYTSTGTSYYNYLVQPPDISPPTTPVLLTANAPSSTTAAMTWAASTDNVGVVNYHMWRNGVALPNTAYTYFTDSGLSNYTTYNYQIEAFDLANNASAPLTFSITTPNSIPPTAPALSGKADSTQEITLTWTASSCPAPISTYVIYEGTSPTSLTKFQTTKGNILTANIWHLTAGTTYYFAVQATQQGLVSPMSTTIAVTTTGAPSAPTHVSATALMATEVEVSWQAPTSGGPVAWYHVYRGTSPHNVTQLVCTANKTSCINYPVSASTTYYYGVEATDSAQNYSPISDIASVTTPAKK